MTPRRNVVVDADVVVDVNGSAYRSRFFVYGHGHGYEHDHGHDHGYGHGCVALRFGLRPTRGTLREDEMGSVPGGRDR
jgi:hypothetical protein